MLPIEFPEKNFTFQKPASMTDKECSSLDVWRGETEDGVPAIISKWQPSREDLDALNRGEGLYLQILGTGMPPVSLYTENPFIQQPQEP